MRFNKPKIAFAILTFHVTCAFASGGGGGGGGGEAPTEGKDAAAPMPKDQKEFIEKSAKLNTLTNRIADAEKNFLELVRKKSETRDIAEKQRLIGEMNEIVKNRNKDVGDYNKLKTDLSLRYPNQGEHLNRRYQTQTKRTVEELEGVAGLDELLTRTKKMVEKKFAPIVAEAELKEAKERKTAPVKAVPPAEEKPQKLRLEK